MNAFQLIKTVLDELYVKIPGYTESDKDALIANKLNYLADRYKNLLRLSEPIDYSDPVTRFAYIYKYVPFHANIIFNVINQSDTIQRLFEGDKVKVSCIGGGPGSDLLGILKYIMGLKKYPTLSFTLFDREEAWGESWEDVGEKLNLDCNIRTYFQRFDIADSNTWLQKEKYLGANLFTMMYFISEIYNIKEKAENYFIHLFTHIPEGSYVLFVDNDSFVFVDWFDTMTKHFHLEIVNEKSGYMQFEDPGERRTDFGKYYQKFCNLDNCRIKTSAQIAYRVCKITSL